MEIYALTSCAGQKHRGSWRLISRKMFAKKVNLTSDLRDLLVKSDLAALTRSHLIGDLPSGSTKEQTETMTPSPRTKMLRNYPRQ